MSKAPLRVNLIAVPSRGKLLITLALAVLAGCYWYKYHRLVRAHAEVLTAMAGKMEDVLAARKGFRPAERVEFRYPYDRASDFVRIVRGRFRDFESFRRFEELLRSYERLLAVVDRLNTPAVAAEESIGEVSRRANDVRRAAGEVLDAVAREE